MHGHLLVGERLQIEGNADAECGGGTEIAVKLHWRGTLTRGASPQSHGWRDAVKGMPLRPLGTCGDRRGFTQEGTGTVYAQFTRPGPACCHCRHCGIGLSAAVV